MLLLQVFIRSHPNDWEEILSEEPYCINIKRDAGFIIFNYNQIKSDFYNPIVKECRGIILRERDFKVVCHPFNKFGNAEEGYSDLDVMDWTTAQVQEKIDGSLMKVWYDEDRCDWRISTNGTIDAFKAPLGEKFKTFGNLFFHTFYKYMDFDQWSAAANPDYCYMFELVSPYNRVVIPYTEEKLYFLGWRELITGHELPRDESVMSEVFDVPKVYNLTSYNDVKAAATQLPWDEEGYVVCDEHFHRVKVKSPQYVLAHHSRNNGNISTEDLVRVVLDHEEAEFLEYCGDYKDDLDAVKSKMNCVANEAINALHEIWGDRAWNGRGDYAHTVMNYPVYIQPFLFACYDTKIFWQYAKDWTPARWARVLDAMN